MKTALVTGATSGIGQAAALALGDAGWWVLATGRDAARGESVAGALARRAGGRFVAAELTEDGAAERLVEACVGATGRLDALVNSAGVHLRASVVDTTPDRYDALMALNVRAAFLLARAAVPPMRAAGCGVIVNVSSESGLVATPGQIAYNMSKATLVMLTKSLCADHAGDGIRSVTVCPGTTRTPMVERLLAASPDPAERERTLASRRPANRLARPEEIAAAIVFACGDEAAIMTGSTLVLDGGFTAV